MDVCDACGAALPASSAVVTTTPELVIACSSRHLRDAVQRLIQASRREDVDSIRRQRREEYEAAREAAAARRGQRPPRRRQGDLRGAFGGDTQES